MDTKSTNALESHQIPTVTISGDVNRGEKLKAQTLSAMCFALDRTPHEIREVFGCRPNDRLRALEEKCAMLAALVERLQATGSGCEGNCSTIQKSCDGLWKLCFETLCPGRVPFSRYTMDEASQENHIVLNEIVPVPADADNVTAFPVAPGQYMVLTHPVRPGFVPKKINIDLHLANGGNNYLDIEIEIFLVSGGKKKKIGVTYEGNNFLNKDGTQIFVAWPEYKGRRIEVGYAEKIEIVLRHTGLQNNLVSASVRLPHDTKEWYELCKHWGYGDCPPSSSTAC